MNTSNLSTKTALMMRTSRLTKLALSSIAIAVLAACGSAPILDPQVPATGDKFVNAPTSTAASTTNVAQFWRGFGDAQLDQLVTQALQANHDIRIAVATLDQVRAQERAAQTQFLPTVNTSAGAARVRTPGTGGAQTNDVYSVGAQVAWEIDLFGRIRNDVSAANANVRAGQAGVRATQVAIAAEVARNYFTLRSLQEQLRVSQDLLTGYRKTLELVQARQSAGRSSGFDTERANALVQSTAAAVPALESALMRTRYRIAVLTGQAPTALDTALAEQKPLPGLPAITLSDVPAPQALLARRPDVAGALARLDGAAARARVSRTALLPTISLGGTLGSNAGRLSDLGNSSAFAYNLGASLVWNLLDFGRARAQIAAADAASQGALASYEKTVLTALEETEGALASYSRAQQQSERLYAAAQSSEKAARIARERFALGASDLLALLDAERELLSARDRLAQAQNGAAASVVNVYQALAGGVESGEVATAAK